MKDMHGDTYERHAWRHIQCVHKFMQCYMPSQNVRLVLINIDMKVRCVSRTGRYGVYKMMCQDYWVDAYPPPPPPPNLLSPHV